MVRNRAHKRATSTYAAEHDLTHAQAAQELARAVPELSDGGFDLYLWRERDWDAGECDLPRCFECGNELPEGQLNIRFPQLEEPKNGLCRNCLHFLREKLDEAEALLDKN